MNKKNRLLKGIIIIVLFLGILGVSLLVFKKQYRLAKDNLRQEESLLIPNIVCIGDSLTQGTDGSYPIYLEDLMIKDSYYMPVRNLGIGGENTVTIAGRLGGIPYKVYAFNMPEDDEPVEISFVEDDIHRIKPFGQPGNDMINPVVINGVAGEISRDEDHFYFTRIFNDEDLTLSQKNNLEENKSLEDKEYYEVETVGASCYQDGIYILFMGENNGFLDIDELIAQQKSIINRQTDNAGRYLIIGMTTGDNASRKELEEAMVNEYGDKYINLREYFTGKDINGELENTADINRILSGDILLDAGRYGIRFTDEDKKEMKEGKVPACLRSDDIHYNNAGYRLLAAIVYERMQQLNYFDKVENIKKEYEKIWSLPAKLEAKLNAR